MQTKILNGGPPRIYAVVLETGEEAVGCLTRFALAENVDAAQLTAIGALSRAVLGFFDFSKKDYKRIAVDEQVELLSLLGDFALADGKPKLHAHVTVGRPDGSVRGGHLLEAIVHPTLEVIITEAPTYLARQHDPGSGLALIRTDDKRSG
jgi:predicted DNA-binding protein with PD1-like motif